ncbi:MAG: MFS transporter [Ferrovibrio sp.]|uniref:MFS transporter n=1 Tax=Ferrovibrio sp. TaxID=1917215 RepID=UPI0026041391|nr:MFS transporter [Ferrovibrio sp.]MCW0232667.1 MFS transporter [Ferrovibrio sp.]
MSDLARPAAGFGFSHPMAVAWILALSVSLANFDVTVVAVVLPAIRDELGFSISATAWVMDAYSLAFAGALFAAGALADRFGRRRMLLLGNAGFALASLLCGLTWDGPSLWFARALQGLCAAFYITGGLAAVSLAYPASNNSARARAFGIIGVTSGAAMALGPTLGGLVAAGFGWRWVFLINLPLCALCDWAVRRVIAESRDGEGRALDLPGVLLLTLAIALPVQALLHSDGDWRWRWAATVAGLLLGLALVWQQKRRARPMLDPMLFRRREAIGIGCLLLTLSVGYWAVLIYLPLYLRAAFGLGMEQAGLAMLAATLPMLALPPVGVWATQRYGWQANFTLGMLLLATGLALLAMAVLQAASLWLALGAMLLMASGAGLGNSQVSGALVALAPPDRAGMASAMATTLRQAGFAIGIALLGAISGGVDFAAAFGVAAAAAALGAVAAALTLKKTLR